MSSSELYTMDGNIRMGTWYMADAKRRLQNNEVMATAGYNAGPGRARNWQASSPLEGRHLRRDHPIPPKPVTT